MTGIIVALAALNANRIPCNIKRIIVRTWEKVSFCRTLFSRSHPECCIQLGNPILGRFWSAGAGWAGSWSWITFVLWGGAEGAKLVVSGKGSLQGTKQELWPLGRLYWEQVCWSKTSLLRFRVEIWNNGQKFTWERFCLNIRKVMRVITKNGCLKGCRFPNPAILNPEASGVNSVWTLLCAWL